MEPIRCSLSALLSKQILLILVFVTQTQWASARDKCNFLCQEIPDEHEILKNWGQAQTAYLNNPTIKILAWNIYKGRKSNFFQEYQKLAADKDIVMISEGTDGDLVKPALDKLKNFGWDMGISFFMKEQVGTGIITGSSAVAKAIGFERTVDLEPVVKSPKIILITKYLHAPSRQEILILNIHGINWADDNAFKRQIQSVEPYLKAHPGPALFAGDFNLRNSNRFQITSQILNKHGMKQVSWSNTPKEKQLDNAYLRGFNVKTAKYVNDVIDKGSDHPAMILELIPN